jgi:TPR repeat protein
MKRVFVIGAFTAASFLAQLPAAQADFFSLDGRFACLESAATVCGEAQAVVKPLPAASPAAATQAAVVDSDEPSLIAPPPAAVSAAAPASSQARAPSIDPLQAVAARIQTRRPSANDIAWLSQAAHNGDARAIELLAWCKLNAIGMARDPLQAYLLYGAASNAALPHARDNQRLIYERDLDSDQRQQVLNLANEGVSLARIMPSAR